jgi:hypothetical protein
VFGRRLAVGEDTDRLTRRDTRTRASQTITRERRSLDRGASVWRETSIPLRELRKGLRVMNHYSSPSSAHDTLVFPLRKMAADRKKSGAGQLR